MKTQTLNTVFTVNAGQALGEVNRLGGAINTALGGIFAKAQAMQAAAAATGMKPTAVQSAERLGGITGISGYGEAVAQMAHLDLQTKGRMSAKAAERLGIDEQAFGAADTTTRFDMLAQQLSKIKDKNERWRAAARTGFDVSTLLARAGNFEDNPDLAIVARNKALASTATEPDIQRLGRGATHLGNVWAGVKGGFFKSVARFGQDESTPQDESGVGPGFFMQHLRRQLRTPEGGPRYPHSGGEQDVYKVLKSIDSHSAGIHDNTK